MPRHDIGCMLGHLDKIERKFAGPNKGRYTTAHIFWSFFVYQARHGFITFSELHSTAVCSGSSGGGGGGGAAGAGGSAYEHTYTESSPPCCEVESATYRQAKQDMQ